MLLILALGRMGTVIFLLVFFKLIDVGLMFEAVMMWHLGLKYYQAITEIIILGTHLRSWWFVLTFLLHEASGLQIDAW